MSDDRANVDRTPEFDDPPGGEILSVLEYLVVAPVTGVFRRLEDRARVCSGQRIERGDVIGLVCSLGVATPVESLFGGLLVEILACEGERVRPGQPLAWLRAA